MLFNSYIFIVVFLPVVFAVYAAISKNFPNHKILIIWLLLSSLVFYGASGADFLFFFVVSLIGNVLIVSILRLPIPSTGRFALAFIGVAANLAYLGSFKYWAFFAGAFIGGAADADFTIDTLALPVGISFYTFQQIALIVETFKEPPKKYSPMKHALFIAFFPQLIAGPIVQYSEVAAQFEKLSRRPIARDAAIGLSIFAIGLFKKVVLADGLAPLADAGFDAAGQGPPALLLAWSATFAYSFQLYFDFSGYSDMALGLARLFGIRLPLNFNSPYKSESLVTFWRRWHMTLSRFLRRYLYIPLGGSRRGAGRQTAALLITMVLGGLWHGAGWSFILWGALHGVLLVVAHYVRRSGRFKKARIAQAMTAMPRPARIALVFLTVTLLWVPFRAPGISETLNMYLGLTGFAGAASIQEAPSILFSVGRTVLATAARYAADPSSILRMEEGQLLLLRAGITLCLSAVIVFGFPNSAQIFRNQLRAEQRSDLSPTEWRWRPTVVWAVGTGTLLTTAFLSISGRSPFLYFQF